MERRAVIVENGTLRELPYGDTLAGVPGVSAWKEPVAALNNDVPELVFTLDGDVVVSDAS